MLAGTSVSLSFLSTAAMASVTPTTLAGTALSNSCLFPNDVAALDSIVQNNSCGELSDPAQADQCSRVALSQDMLCHYAQGLNSLSSSGGSGSSLPPLPPVSAQSSPSATQNSSNQVQSNALPSASEQTQATNQNTNNKKSTFNWF